MSQARAPWSSFLSKEQLPWESDRPWTDRLGISIKRVGAILLCVLFVLLLGSWWHAGAVTGRREDAKGLKPDIFNSTLGVSTVLVSRQAMGTDLDDQFQKLLVLNLPERSDNRDVLQLQGALTDIDFGFVDGVHGDTIPEKALPPGGGQRLGPASVGSWRAHINALRQYVAGHAQAPQR